MGCLIKFKENLMGETHHIVLVRIQVVQTHKFVMCIVLTVGKSSAFYL